MKILCVEDGSVDVDDLPNRKEWRDDKILVYRQGARQPFVLEISEESVTKDIVKELTELKLMLKDLLNKGVDQIAIKGMIQIIDDRLSLYGENKEQE